MISSKLYLFLEQYLQSKHGNACKINRIESVSGGSINQAYCIFSSAGKYFLKRNATANALAMFQQETAALSILSKSTALCIPNIFLLDKLEEEAFLLMEFLDSEQMRKDFWEDFGRGLAALHTKSSAQGFGWTENNFIGNLKQENAWQSKWSDFFVEKRLMVQEKIARDQGVLDESTSALLAKLYAQMDDIFPIEKSSLLHGDLWSGNFLVNSDGKAALIDPSIYYGHREMDLAMSLLFGGFQKEFYKAYHEYFPLEKAWERRVDICNLYPLLVHVNLFGSAYATRVKSLLKQLV